MSEYLPPEIITQILLRLPIKSLLQCTSICKSWNSLIKHTRFINNHLNLNLDKTSNSPLLLLRHCPKDPTRELYSLHLDNGSFQEHSKPELPVQSLNECFRIVGSCNGLILLSDDYFTDYNMFVLWNPSIRKFITLAKPHVPKSPHHSVYGFGFDSKKNDYKVVRLVYLRQNEGQACPEIELYSLNSGSWKSITSAAPSYQIAQNFRAQVFVNGAVHWVASCKKGNCFRNVVLSFDMSNETFQEIELPEDLASELPTKYMPISAAGKSICVKHFDQNRHTMWVMREYGVVESWEKQVSVDVHVTPNFTPNFRVLQVLGCRKNNGEFLLERYDHRRKIGELVSHDPKKKTNEFLGVHTDPGYSCIVYYTESLVLLDKTSRSMQIS
ncbi:hypothetical protein L3X38_017156 [Prunus dulcis]|uniref:F-box domain-containing protein n=1 Tax=Prunus dulcis TaxID=3755 RepID=A0AAD4Z9I4_PRUDU|nr:hypothetical protein L3X38_017156 [Prunus dulcis]